MKERNGFVSNSSSSSFVVAFKNELTKEKLLEVFNINKDSPLFFFAEDIANFVLNEKWERINTVKDLLDYHGFDEEEAIDCGYKDEIEKIKAGWKMIIGWASYNEAESPIEYYFSNSRSLEIKTDDIYIKTGD